MKAKYVKPALIMERFELTQSIATTCGADPNSSLGDPNQGSKTTCGWVVGNVAVWDADANSKCSLDWGTGDDDIFEGVCYNNPDGVQTIFSS